MRQLFYHKMQHNFIIKCVKFFITECDSSSCDDFVTNCESTGLQIY